MSLIVPTSGIGWRDEVGRREKEKEMEMGRVADRKQTVEIARLQIGDDPEQARVLVTDIADAENLLPLFMEYEKEGRQINVSSYPRGEKMR